MTGRRALALVVSVAALVTISREAPARPEAAGVAPIGSATELLVFPPELRLDDQDDRVQVVVQLALPDGTTRDATALAEVLLVDAAVARVSSALVVEPGADGATTLRIRCAGLEREVPVVVRGAALRRAPSFENDVVPVLTRAGCNSGSCHGTSRGKDGFHLSLFGYDPQGDLFRLTREQVGRRVDLAAPGESLLLRKATGEVRHGGGRRIEPGGRLARTVQAWLEAGAPADPADLPALARIELRPERTVLLAGPGDPSQRLSVRAIYADGRDRDVTELAALATSDASVARLGSDLAVHAGRCGEAWLTARFGDQVVGAGVLVVPDDPTFTFPAGEPDLLAPAPADASRLAPVASPDELIDRHVNGKLQRLRARPAPLCDDATFLRRATLDITGRLPAPEEVTAFLGDAAPDKRAVLVDRLLERPAFVQLMTMLLAERFMVRSTNDRVSEKAALRWAAWLEARVTAGVPLDRLVRELLTASGGSFDTPAVSFFVAEEDTKKLSENVAQAFLGIRLQCAQCHDHPFDRWTQDDYHGFAAFFAQVGRKAGGDPRERVVYDRSRGELEHPVTKRPSVPRFLAGEAPKVEGKDRREVLADWITSPDNPWFARHAANLLWAHLLGVGIVHEPDDVRVSNPPSHPALLDALGARLRASGYDLKALVRLICASRAYQRASAGTSDAPGSDRTFARAQVRRLRAEVLLDALSQATDAPEDFAGLPRGARAVELEDGSATTDFLTTFGRATRDTPCTCEVRVAPNLGQALHLLNGDTVHRKLKQGKLVARLLKGGATPDDVVRALYLRTVSRPATEAEVARVRALLEGVKDPAPVLDDLLWALLNSREFVFTH